MAGDWIKMRINLASEPEVIALAERLNLDEDHVVGKLHRFWSWADQQSNSGNAVGVTRKWIDRYMCVTNFAAELEKVGWLTVTDDGVSVPGFDRHMSEGAKKRALTSRRVARNRAKDCNASSVTSALPEKRREDNTPLPPNGGGGSMTLVVEDLKDHKRLAAWHDAGCPGLDPPVPSHLLAAVIATANECRTVGRRPLKLFWHKMRQLAATGQYDGPGDLYDDAKRLVAKRPKGSS